MQATAHDHSQFTSEPSSGPYDSAANVGDLDALIAGNPPLPRIGIQGYPRDTADRIAQILQRYTALFIRVHPFLSFDALEYLIVGADYREALALYETQGFAYDKNFSESAETSLAIVFPTQSGVVAIIHPQLIQQLRSEVHQEWIGGIRILWHELCHVYDVAFRREWLLQRAQSRRADGTLYWRCASLWAEYFANRFSHFNGADLGDDWRRLELLLEHMPQMEPALAAKRLTATFGYVLGSLAAQRSNIHELRPDLDQQLRRRGLAAAWLEASTATDELVQSCDCWHHADGVLRLATAARLIEKACRFGST